VDYEDFVRDRLPSLLRYAAVLSGDHDLAADLVQDVVVKAHVKWPRIAAAGAPEAYVKRMVTNEYLSWRRRWSVRTVTAAPDELLHARAGAGQLRDTAQDTVERDEAWTRLAGLPRQQRAVLVLRYYEGLDDAEIAAALHCAPATVRAHASRALAALRLDDRQEVS
jgi:RNA polymerase sigma-70 factor (sigma-E family)